MLLLTSCGLALSACATGCEDHPPYPRSAVLWGADVDTSTRHLQMSLGHAEHARPCAA